MKKQLLICLILLLSAVSCNKDSSEPIIENIKPFVELISPLYLSYANIGDTVLVSALASDEDGDVKSVLFYKDALLFAYDSVSPWENSFICTQVKQMTISVMAIDDKDGLSDKKLIYLNVVEEDKPVIWFSKEPYTILKNDKVVFTVNSHSPNGKIVKVDFYLNDNLYGSDTLAESIFAVDSIELGVYKAYAIVEDEEGKIKKSDDIIFTVEDNQAPWIEFSIYSHSGYFPGQCVSISAQAHDTDGTIDSMFVFVNDSLIYCGDDSDPSGLNYSPPKEGIYNFNVICSDDRGLLGYSDTIAATIKPGYVLDGKLVDLTSSNHDNLVFGLDQTNNELLLINPITTEKEDIALPHSQPIKFYYSMNDEKLYIIYKYDGVISVWDYNTQSFSEISFSENADAIDIEVDDINRRIYVLASNGLNIINQDNDALLNTTSLYSIYDIAIDPSNRWLFACSHGSSISVKKYNVENDVPELLQSKSFSGTYKNQIRINHKYNYFIIPGMGESYKNLAIDIDNLDNIIGEFSYGAWYNYSNFSHDNNLLFTSLENYNNDRLKIINAENYMYIDEIDMPNTNTAIMCSNYSQNKLVVFSYDNFYNTELTLFFFDINY